MKFIHFAALVAPTAALVPDSSLANGIYAVSEQSVITNIQETNRIAPRGYCKDRKCSYLSADIPSGRVLKDRVPIPKSKPFCYQQSNDTIPTDEYHEALNMLFQAPLFWIPPESARFALYNNTVVYLCNLSRWNSGSLIEYMDAMSIWDKKCGDKFPWTAAPAGHEHVGKLAVPGLDMFFGRDRRGRTICQEETEDYWMANELPNMENRLCQSFVSGAVNIFRPKEDRCNWDGGEIYNKYIKGLYSWWRHA